MSIKIPMPSEGLKLADRDVAWLRAKWRNIRESQQKADRAARDWSSLNDAVNRWLRDHYIDDPVQVTKIKGENLGLKDALSSHRWHSDEAQRHIDDVNLFLRMKELGVL